MSQEIDPVIQYLDWAMLAAHKIANPDCAKVTLELNLANNSTTTSFLHKGEKPYKPPTMSERETLVFRLMCLARLAEIRKAIEQCMGQLYPGVLAHEMKEIKELFLHLTGQPLDDKEPKADER